LHLVAIPDSRIIFIILIIISIVIFIIQIILIIILNLSDPSSYRFFITWNQIYGFPLIIIIFFKKIIKDNDNNNNNNKNNINDYKREFGVPTRPKFLESGSPNNNKNKNINNINNNIKLVLHKFL